MVQVVTHPDGHRLLDVEFGSYPVWTFPLPTFPLLLCTVPAPLLLDSLFVPWRTAPVFPVVYDSRQLIVVQILQLVVAPVLASSYDILPFHWRMASACPDGLLLLLRPYLYAIRHRRRSYVRGDAA